MARSKNDIQPRKDRVHIRYEGQIDNRQMKVDLPYVIGVMGDFSGDGEHADEAHDRRFKAIDRDNFNDVMRAANARLTLDVPETLSGRPDRKMHVQLSFRKMDDFRPESIVSQVEPLRELQEIRQQLADLLRSSDRSRDLRKSLGDILQRMSDPAQRDALKARLNIA
jgi:type VI secretion system protein ImpB